MNAEQFQNLLTLAAIGLITIGVGGSSWILFRGATGAARRRTRLAGDAGLIAGGGSGSVIDFSAVVSRVSRFGDRMAITDPSKLSALRAKLAQAGFFSREAVTVYLGARAVAMCIAIAATVAVLPWILGGHGGFLGVLVAAVFAGAAVLGPDQVIKSRRLAREREYRDGFPDLLDLLVASVEAGLSLDAAVSRVTDELIRRYPHLAEHLKFLTLELRAGRSRKDAWAALSDRLGIDEARSLSTMLRQAEEMGTSLGETLAIFSDDMRAKRMLRAEEKAMALPAKLMIPLILFIFPCLLGVLILPAAFRISQSLVVH
jgi:tight adherence protein C